MDRKPEHHFVLVHGACHGAWCWYKVIPQLRQAGHRVTALDLAASGIHPKQLVEVKSFSDYSEPLMEFMAGLPSEEKVILVGHSFGGLFVAAAMDRFPEKISVAVFSPAMLLGPDFIRYKKRRDYGFVDSKFMFDDGPDKPPTAFSFGPKDLSSILYQLSPPEDLTLATMLVRPMGLWSEAELSKAMTLSEERYGSIKRVYIVNDGDNMTKIDYQRWIIEKSPPDDIKVISGSDHMVMLSKPQELSTCLLEIAKKILMTILFISDYVGVFYVIL